MENIIYHKIDYSLDELKKLIISKNDAEVIHRIKRYMFSVITSKNLPGEIFRKYPKNINFAYHDFRPFLQSDESKKYNIEVSNYGRIKINNDIKKQIEEKIGYFYVKTEKIHYPVWRFVAEVWCEFPFDDTLGWQVHHISNDGNDNTPDNLMWIKDSSHNSIPKYAVDKLNIENYKDINVIIENINLISG